jgi:3-hydroxyisobutyrate dehydrogenase-like beta-hydroxyacid dehydrogenase
MDVGFVGIGRMGSRMAARLLAAGHRLAIYDVAPEACRPLAARGATVAAAADEVARSSEIVLTSVPGPAEVAAAIEGPRGILGGARPGTLVVETSTIGPAQSQALAERCGTAGVTYIDAPVSNGVEAAETGKLTVMVGGDKSAFEKALPILRQLGNRVYHLGPVGSGNVAKIANQVVYLSYVVGFCEMAKLGRQFGLDVSALVDILRHSVAGSPLTTGWDKRIGTEDIEGGFRIRRVLKDLQLGADLCTDQGFDAPVFQAALETYREAARAGFAENDMTAIYSGFAARRGGNR